MKLKLILYAALFSTFATNCTVVQQGEVGVKRSFGKISANPLMEGARGLDVHHNPITVPLETIEINRGGLKINF
ncbi:MAG: hypothetical protein H7202_09595 [Pedobacter sp.]|nr:hypothetical protein [Pedobacter sp.]